MLKKIKRSKNHAKLLSMHIVNHIKFYLLKIRRNLMILNEQCHKNMFLLGFYGGHLPAGWQRLC